MSSYDRFPAVFDAAIEDALAKFHETTSRSIGNSFHTITLDFLD